MDTQLDDLRGARVLVTGGAGLIGSRITNQLADAGAEPFALDRLDAYPPDTTKLIGPGPGVEVVRGDVTDAALVGTLVRRADYVLHAAAFADVAACTNHPEKAFTANIAGTQTLLEQVRKAGTVRRLVFVSSASVYGDGGGPVAEFREDQPPHPISVYANGKLWGEHQVKLMLDGAATSYTILRYFSVYGRPQVPKEGSHSWMVAWMAMSAHLGLPLRLNGGGRQVRDMVHVNDVARASVLALVAERAADQTVNVGTGIPTSVRTIAERIASHYPGARLVDAPRPAGDPLGGYAATERSRDLLCWQPGVTVYDGIDDYVAWLRATPNAIPSWLRARCSTAA